MSDARDLFSEAEGRPEPPPKPSPVLRELALMRLLLEAIRADLTLIREEVDAWASARPTGAARDWEDPPPPGVGAPLAAGGGASYPGFPAAFRTRSGGSR